MLQSLHANPVPVLLYKVLKRPKLTLDEMLAQLATTETGQNKPVDKSSRAPSRASKPLARGKTAPTVRARPASAPVLRQGIHPHHHQSVDKTLFAPPSQSRPASRPSRPNTPLIYHIHPHQHASPERTLFPVVDDRFPRLGRTGRVPDEHLMVAEGVLDLNGMILGENNVHLTLYGPENQQPEENKACMHSVTIKLEVTEGEWINDVQKRM